MADKIDINLRVKEYEDKIKGITSQIQELETKVANQKKILELDKAILRIQEEQEKSGEKITSSAYVDNRTTKELSQKILENQKKIDAQMATINKLKEQRVGFYDVQIENELKEMRKAKIAAQKSKEMAAVPIYKSSVKIKDVASLKKSLKEGRVVSLESFLNKEGGKHDYEATNKEIEEYLKEAKAIRVSATEFAHLRETGYKDFKSEIEVLESQLKTATGNFKEEIENRLKNLKTFQANSKRKAPVGNELHKILELSDKGLVDLSDAVKAQEQIQKQMKLDADTYRELKTLVKEGSAATTQMNFADAIKNAQDFQKMKISAGMIGGETETARSIVFEKNGKTYLVSGSTDWTNAEEGKIGDYKTTSIFDPIHNLIQSIINATLIRSQEGEEKEITSKVVHLPLTNQRGRYTNTLPGIYDINVGSYQEGMKLISDLLDVLEGRKSFSDVKVPGSVQGVAERGEQTYRGETREGWYYNGKPIGFWLEKTVEEVKSLLDSLNPQQKQQFLGTLYGDIYSNSEKNVKALREAFKTMYRPTQEQYKTYGGMSLSALSSKFESGEITEEQLGDFIRKGVKTQEDVKELANRLFYGGDKYYQPSFVKAIRGTGVFGELELPDYQRKNELEKELSDLAVKGKEIEEAVKSSVTKKYTEEQRRLYNEIQKQMQNIAQEIEKTSFVTGRDVFEELVGEFLEKDQPGYLSGLSKEEKPQPSKYDIYMPDDWELEERKQQSWLEAGIERNKLGYTDKPMFDDKGVKTLADRMTRLVDFYQRTTNIFNKIAEDINKDLPTDIEPYTGEELARTYLARKSPEVYDRYMRSKGLYEGFTEQAQGLSLEEQVQWIRKQLDTFIAEEGNLINTFDTFTKIADQESKEVFSKEFARKISYVGAPGSYIAPGTLYGLLMGSTFGVAQEGQIPEFNKLRGRDIYGRTLSEEAIDKLAETQADDYYISEIDFYKQKLSEMAEGLGISAEKIGVFTDYLARVQKVADQLGIELEEVLEGIDKEKTIRYGSIVDERKLVKKGSSLEKHLTEEGVKPIESLYLPKAGKRGIGGEAREKLFDLFDDTGIDNLATQYDLYLNEQANKRDEEFEKQEDIRVQKEQEFTKLIDVELENRLKFLYAQTSKPDYIKEQEKNERLAEEMGLSSEMFEEISKDKQETPGTTLDEIEIGADAVQKDNKEDLAKTIEEEVKVKEQGIEKEKQTQEAQEVKTQAVKEEVQAIQRETEQIKGQGEIQDVRKRGKMDDSYDKWIVDRVVKNELGEVTDTIYKKSRKSSGARGPSGISQVVDKVIPAVENIDKNIDEINNKIPGSLKNIDWESFQKWAETQERVEGKEVTDSSRVKNGGGDGGKPPKSGGRKGKSDEERVKEAEEKAAQNAQKAEEKRLAQMTQAYKNYLSQRLALLTKIEAAQAQYNITSGKEKAAAQGVITQRKIELDYLDQKNEKLIEDMKGTQQSTKADLDYVQAMKVASMQQEKLLGKKGAANLWDVIQNDIKRATMRFADFNVVTRSFGKISQDIQKVIQYTKELNSALTDIRIVGGYSNEEAESLMRNYTVLAQKLGVSTTEIAQGMNDWLRQGYEVEAELEALVSASTKLAKLGMISTAEATKDLTSALKGFKLASEDAISVVDKLTKIDQVSAISAGNLAEGLARVSTTAQQAGLSLDETAAMVSTITEVTQRDASTAGEALRTLISRYSNVKAGVFTSMGEEAEDTSANINDIEKVLGKLGIRIRTSATEMRDIESVLDELAGKWDALDDISRNAVGTAFAGVRQRESFNILMANWDRVKELTEESEKSAGTADEKYSAYTESIEASTKRIQNAWEEFTQTIKGSGIIKVLNDISAAALRLAPAFIKFALPFLVTARASKITNFVTASINKGKEIFGGGVKGLASGFVGKEITQDVMFDENGKPILGQIETKKGLISSAIDKGAERVASAFNAGDLSNNVSSILKVLQDDRTKKAVGKESKLTAISNDGISFKTYARLKPLLPEGEKDKNKGALGALRAKIYQEEYAKQVADYERAQSVAGTSRIKTGRFKYQQLYKTTDQQQFAYDKSRKGYYYLDEKGGFNNLQVSDKIAKQAKSITSQQITNMAITGALTGVASGLMLAQQRSIAGKGTMGGNLASALTGGKMGEQQIEDPAASVSKGIVGGLGSALSVLPPPWNAIGPVISVLGPVVVDFCSTMIHRSELEMKQRVQEAKENLQALESIKSAVDNGASVMSSTIATSDDYAKLKEYTDNLFDTLYDYISEYGKEFFDSIISNLVSSGVVEENDITEISDLMQLILDGNDKERELIQKQIDIALIDKKIEQTEASNEETFNKIATGAKTFKSNELWGDNSKLFGGGTIDLLSEKGFSVVDRKSVNLGGLSAEEGVEKINEILKETKDLDEKSRKALEDYRNELQGYANDLQKIKKENIALASEKGILVSDILKLDEEDIEDWGLDGLIMKVAQVTDNAKTLTGTIRTDYYNAIKTAIKSNSHFNSILQKSGSTIGDLTSKQKAFKDLTDKDGGGVVTVADSWERWYEVAMQGKLEDSVAKVVFAANPERIKLFANAWNMTVEEAEKLADKLPGLTTALGSMTPSEVLDYYTNLSDIFSDLADNAILTAKNFDEIISKYPKLMALYGRADKKDLQAEILKSIGAEQKTAYSNALLNEFLDSEGYISLMRTGINGDEDWGKDQNEYVKDALSLNTMRELYQRIAYLKNLNTEESNAAAQALEERAKTLYGKDMEIEWEDPLYTAAKEAEIYNQDKIIKNLEEQKDALGKINDERKKEIELIKARDALENAKKEKVRVYRAGVGWTYEANEEAISQAQENLDELDTQKRQEDLQYQIDTHQQLKDILENLESEKKAARNQELLTKWFEQSGYDSASSMVAAVIDGFGNQLIKFNPYKQTKGTESGTVHSLTEAETQQIESTKKELSKLGDLTAPTKEGKSLTQYNAEVDEYNRKYDEYNRILSEAKNKSWYDTAVKADEEFAGYTKKLEGKERLEEEIASIPLQGVLGTGGPNKELGTLEYGESNTDNFTFSYNGKKYKLKATGDDTTEIRYRVTEAAGMASKRNKGDMVYVPDINDGSLFVVAQNKKGNNFWARISGGSGYSDLLSIAQAKLNTNAKGTESFQGGRTLINELGTEAVITPSGTLTALPSKTGIVPADITRNVWALGEVAPTLVAQLNSLSQKPVAGNVGNTTYEEGQYFDHFTMNVYPAKGDDLDKILQQARAHVALTRHNN